MAKAQNKTVETSNSVPAFLKTVKDEKKRKDCLAIVELIEKHSGMKAKMWGTAIVGFGSYHYKYESGREGDAPLIAFSPRASSIVIYLSHIKEEKDLLKKLGKHKLSGGCAHIQKLEDIDTGILIKLMDISVKHLKKTYPA
jgi:Domain of unknown function (DU1801)